MKKKSCTILLVVRHNELVISSKDFWMFWYSFLSPEMKQNQIIIPRE